MAALRAALMPAALAALLGACAQPTNYAPAGPGSTYGYADEKLDSTTYRVSFAGNSATPREQVERLLLYRAAKLAEEQGAPWFAVIDQNLERETRYYGTVYPHFGAFGYGRYWPHGFARPYPYYHFGAPATANLHPSHRYTGYATVRLFGATPPEGLGVPYHTGDVLSTIGAAVGAAQGASQS